VAIFSTFGKLGLAETKITPGVDPFPPLSAPADLAAFLDGLKIKTDHLEFLHR
jgi:hypothetical protein